ncbi:hypothetical protein FB008_11940 [Sinorhizobium medicae]|uniref:Uncharacterized protein n=1 Tax=Sinorhizobium medicae TaxID=110321 RepID=A0A508WUW4_9HYPH|nr:hypothetical protein FB008_11940 [Sinorhizobium medicae]VTZ59449.1 hypothetical protein EMEDMD4_1080027 [Sinorhizobium medicae]
MSIRSISACSEAESVDSKVIGATDHQFDGLLVKKQEALAAAGHLHGRSAKRFEELRRILPIPDLILQKLPVPLRVPRPQ